MKIEFSHIEISNFLSYGNKITTIDLKTASPILIQGKNYVSSSDGSDSNGAGKSSILNAICFCVYDSVLFNVNKDELINDSNKKDLMVNLYLSVNGIKYKFQRFRKNKHLGGDGIKIFKHQEDHWNFTPEHECTPDSTTNANTLIEKILGISYDAFTRIVIFSATNSPFLSLPAADQISILEELFGYSEVTEKANMIKDQMKISKQTLEKEIAVNNAIQEEIKRRESQISNLKILAHEWKIKNETQTLDIINKIKQDESIDISLHENSFREISKIEKNILDLESENRDLQNKIDIFNSNVKKSNDWNIENNNSIKSLTDELLNIVSVDFDVEESLIAKKSFLQTEIRVYKDQVIDYNNKIKNLAEKIDLAENNIKTLKESKCPHCGQHYENAAKELIEQQFNLSELEDSAIRIENELSNAENKLCELNIALTEVKTNYTTEALSTLKNKRESITKKIEFLKEQKNPFNISEQLFLEPEAIQQNKDLITEYNEKIKSIKTTLVIPDERHLSDVKSGLKFARERLNDLMSEKNPYEASLTAIENTPKPENKDETINELNKLIKHQDFLIKLLTKKDSFIRKNLLQKNLPLLNSRLKLYLNKMGLPHKVTFLENMTAEIKQFDNAMNFNKLSSGQKARINLALSFAFRDVLQYRHGNVNFCLLDECLDVGLSNTGVQLAVKFIKEVAKEQNLSLFVISHRDEASSMFDNKLLIEYKNGFSEITKI